MCRDQTLRDEGERACCSFPSCDLTLIDPTDPLGSAPILIEDLTDEGKCATFLGAENCVCGGGQFLSLGHCRRAKNVGERCNALTSCADGLVCTVLGEGISRCYPEYNENGFDDNFCAALYSPSVHQLAIDLKKTLTFGVAVGVAAGVTAAIEVGVVYGRNG